MSLGKQVYYMVLDTTSGAVRTGDLLPRHKIMELPLGSIVEVCGYMMEVVVDGTGVRRLMFAKLEDVERMKEARNGR